MFAESLSSAISEYKSSNFLGYGERGIGKTELFFSGSKSLFD